MPNFKKNPNAPSPMYKMKGNPMQRNFPDWFKKKADMIQGTIHEIAGNVAKGFKGTDTEKLVKGVKSTEVYKDVKGAGSTIIKDAKDILSKLFKKKSPKRHTGSASHPTGAIAAHKGHMSKKMTKKIKRDIVPK
jgi:hypothetical protein